jgi:hypothetical protein
MGKIVLWQFTFRAHTKTDDVIRTTEWRGLVVVLEFICDRWVDVTEGLPPGGGKQIGSVIISSEICNV